MKREHNLYSRYRIRTTELEALLAKQDGLCAICKEPPQKTLCVDHDHETGKIRGLLCHSCNRGIGLLKDSYQITVNASKYLKRNK